MLCLSSWDLTPYKHRHYILIEFLNSFCDTCKSNLDKKEVVNEHYEELFNFSTTIEEKKTTKSYLFSVLVEVNVKH